MTIFRRRRHRRPDGPGHEPSVDSAEEPAEDPSEEPDDRTRTGVRGSVREVRAALAPVGKRRVVVAGASILGVAIFGVLVLSGISFWWTSQPSFCARCHVMEPYIEAWKVSPHREVNCESCHLRPGLLAFVGGKIASLQVVLNYVRGNYEDYSFSAQIANASCLECHEEILEGDVHASGVRVSHLNIIEMGGKCMSCHSTVAHGSAVPVGSETHPTMSACLKCHNDQTAPLKCSLCHTGKVPPSPTEGGASPEGP